ncbi:MAG: non-ribosomal peptide synthetase, partial [Lysobacter sp.]
SPDQDVRRVAFTPAADLENYRHWNLTRTDYPDTACVHELVSQSARRVPDAIAVRDARCELSYARLETISDAVARMLVASGAGAGARVAVCMDPSSELMVALLGVLKCGASYIPLEMKNTPARMRSILDDAAVDMVLGVRGLADMLGDSSTPLLTLDGCVEDGWTRQWQAPVLPTKVSADASAYVIYTSGSTGTPKGVDVPHRGLTEYCVFASRNYYQPDLDGSLVATSHGFDITVPSLYLPLLAGDCVNLLSQDDILHRVADILAAPEGDNYLLRMTPMHVHALRAILPADHVSPARHVFVIGGERFLPADAKALQALFPASTLFNHYGPSETVVGCCMYNISENVDRLGDVLPIGSAMSNTCLFVLDQAMQQVPIGVAGELYIGGDGVSKGYVNRPELTAERFVRNPFGPEWAPRLYRTGDLVHFDTQGRLVFLGRVDEQIKLRGYRIEPTEIEAHIAVVDGVDKAVVIAAGEGEHQYLVAYLVPSRLSHDSDDESELVARVRRSLRAVLPDYLNPSAYVCVERLPLSANGKLDRRALPAPQRVRPDEMSFPGNADEATLRELWASVLAIDADSISTTAGFFDIGGHSLLAIMLIESVNRRFGARIPLSSLYTAATIRDQAALLALDDARQTSHVVAMQPGSNQRPLFLIHPVGGDVLCYRHLVRKLELDCAVYGIQHEAFTSTDAVSLKHVQQLADDYCERIRQLQPQGPYRLAGWSLGGVIALAIAHRLEEEGEAVSYLGMLDSVLDHSLEPW